MGFVLEWGEGGLFEVNVALTVDVVQSLGKKEIAILHTRRELVITTQMCMLKDHVGSASDDGEHHTTEGIIPVDALEERQHRRCEKADGRSYARVLFRAGIA